MGHSSGSNVISTSILCLAQVTPYILTSSPRYENEQFGWGDILDIIEGVRLNTLLLRISSDTFDRECCDFGSGRSI